MIAVNWSIRIFCCCCSLMNGSGEVGVDEGNLNWFAETRKWLSINNSVSRESPDSQLDDCTLVDQVIERSWNTYRFDLELALLRSLDSITSVLGRLTWNKEKKTWNHSILPSVQLGRSSKKQKQTSFTLSLFESHEFSIVYLLKPRFTIFKSFSTAATKCWLENCARLRRMSESFLNGRSQIDTLPTAKPINLLLQSLDWFSCRSWARRDA